MVVVLPQPLEPRKPKISPRSISKLTLSTAVKSLKRRVSPRATIAIDRCARAHAWLKGRDFVSPDDIQAVAGDVLRHRLILSFEAEANGVTPDKVIEELLAIVPVG